MGTTSGIRIANIEELVSAAAQKQRERQPRYCDYVIRNHTIAGAAIVLTGAPKIDEPLARAWKRPLRHFEIEVSDPLSRDGQSDAAWQLWPKIKNDQKESTQFTKIFSTAPAWFLQFTRIAFDAYRLKFDLPRTMIANLRWGSHGFEAAQQWPLLPWGTMTAGDPIPRGDERQMMIALSAVPCPSSHQIKADSESQLPRPCPPLVRDIEFALDLGDKPEEQWTRYERRRMRQLEQRIARLR
jgi:hypothetical protein